MAFLSFLTLSAAVYADPVPPAIVKALKPFTIKSAELSSGVLRVVMDRPMVSVDMYRAAGIRGACHSLIGNPKAWGKAKIERIEVLNDIAAQGYALEDAAQICTAIADGKLTADQEEKRIADTTVGCIAGNCSRR